MGSVIGKYRTATYLELGIAGPALRYRRNPGPIAREGPLDGPHISLGPPDGDTPDTRTPPFEDPDAGRTGCMPTRADAGKARPASSLRHEP